MLDIQKFKDEIEKALGEELTEKEFQTAMEAAEHNVAVNYFAYGQDVSAKTFFQTVVACARIVTRIIQ